jgi:HK97 family phage major capsid protein
MNQHEADEIAAHFADHYRWTGEHAPQIRSRTRARRRGYAPDASASAAEDDQAALRMLALATRDRATLTDDEAAELDGLQDWYVNEGHLRYVAPADPYGRSQLRELANRALSGAPGQGESVGTRAGYGAGDLQAQPTDRGGWVSTPGADPHLAPHRRNAMQTIERYQRANIMSARDADRVDQVLRSGDPDALTARYIAAVGADAYSSAFGKMLADPQMGHMRFGPQEVEAVREASFVKAATDRASMTTGSTGFPLPLTVDSSIIKTGTGALNPVRGLASVSTIGTHDWVGVSSDGVTAAYVQEGVEATDVSPTLAGPKISTQQFRSFVTFSIEAGQDWPGLQAQLVELVRDAVDVNDATMFLTGNGTNQPFGIFGGDATYSLVVAQRIQSAGAAAYAVGDPWLLKAGIPARFLANATFAAAPATWDTTYRFVGGNSTEPVQMPTRDGPFLGRPKVEWSTMATGAATGTKLIVGGDFRTAYKIVDRMGLTAELIPHMLGTNRLPLGVRGLYVYGRTGAAVVARNALRYLEVK